MGVHKLVTVTYTCDLCGTDCPQGSGYIRENVSEGDGRDVGPSYVEATMTYFAPYVTSDGSVCKDCKVKYLSKYIERLKEDK